MSILARIKAKKVAGGKKVFGIVASKRLGGKTTLGGTLPGKTLLLQASVLESGSSSAEQLAKKLGNEVHVENFSSVAELKAIAQELSEDMDFDNVYVDGVTAVTEMAYADPRTQTLLKKNVWDGYREIGDQATDMMLLFKQLTYSEHAKKPKNVFMTCALIAKTDQNGNVTDVELEAKGRVAITSLTKLGEAVVTLAMQATEEGPKRIMLTKSQGVWPGRIDGILDEKNPAVLSPDLGELLTLIQGDSSDGK